MYNPNSNNKLLHFAKRVLHRQVDRVHRCLSYDISSDYNWPCYSIWEFDLVELDTDKAQSEVSWNCPASRTRSRYQILHCCTRLGIALAK